MPWPHHKNKSSSPDDVRAAATTASSTDSDLSAVSNNGSRMVPSRQASALEKPALAKLRVQVIGAQGLAGKDRSGLSDPFIILNLPGAPPPTGTSSKKDREFYRRRTPVQPKTLEPVWKEGEATFEWNITSDWFLPNGSDESQNVIQEETARVTSSPERSIEANVSGMATPVIPGGTQTDSPMIEKVDDPLATSGGRLGDQLKPDTPRRPSNVRKISAATTKVLGASVRMTTKGAAATTRAVRKRGTTRPMRLKKGTKGTNGGTVDPRHFQTQHSSVGSVEFVVWDKDKWSGNDYMGECSLPVASWVQEGCNAGWDKSQTFLLPLVSSRRNAKVSGEISIRIGIVAASNREADEIYSKLVLASTSAEGAGIRSIPADQSVGTTGPSEAFVDYDSDSDSDADSDSGEREELVWDGASTASGSDAEAEEERGMSTSTEVDESYDSDHPPAVIPQITTTTDEIHAEGEDQLDGKSKSRRRYLLPKKIRRSPSAVNSATASDAADEGSPAPSRQSKIRVKVKRPRRRQDSKGADSASDAVQEQQAKQSRQRKRKAGRRKRDLAFKTELGMDIIGIVQMEVKGATDLPRWKNSLGTSFDMDAFVIVSFGERIFRTRVARHSLNPTWDEKLLFRVRQHESNFVTKMAIYDWDKLSANDYVGSVELRVGELIEAAPKPDRESGLYAAADDGTQHGMKTFQLLLNQNDRLEESKNIGKHHKPVLTIEAKFTPYECLRQRFWRQLLMQYDTNDSGTLSNLELTSMLDSLGSTLSTKTIQNFFSQFGRDEERGDELTVEEAIIALEREIKKPWSEKRYVDKSWDGIASDSRPLTPSLGDAPPESISKPLDMTGPDAPSIEDHELAARKATIPASVADDISESTNEKSTKPVIPSMTKDMSSLSLTNSSTSSGGRTASKRGLSTSSTASSSNDLLGPSLSGEGATSQEEQIERVIVLKSCPLCHMPRLSKKAEVDIVTHLAVCASQDWRRVDSMVVSNFVTASQAHRKWYTKVITKISQGQYQLGANSANIIVQDRMTGELLEEKMQVYVRLGIRLLYKGARSRMEGARIKRMLKNMSIKQGVKFDSPASAREISQFIAFHNLNLDEIRDPLESFKTFNEFFYRKLKENARPITDPDDPTTLVSAADCRLMAFSSITEATKIWIKGREFTVDRLLGDQHKGSKLDTFRQGGSLVIFRLAPQDYHRFHCPADAIVTNIQMITGQYYTVNPMAIRSAIDVYGENVRAVVEFKSEAFGVFYCVCIGAMMVGSINLVVKEGDKVKRGDEFGYYAFGGSTNVCIFEQGRVELDEDLLANSRNATETLVRVGMRIGKASSSNSIEE